jgi:hypothetical protein
VTFKRNRARADEIARATKLRRDDRTTYDDTATLNEHYQKVCALTLRYRALLFEDAKCAEITALRESEAFRRRPNGSRS